MENTFEAVNLGCRLDQSEVHKGLLVQETGERMAGLSKPFLLSNAARPVPT